MTEVVIIDPITYDIEFKSQTNDFYLQWKHICWWQFKFDLKAALRNEFKRRLR